MDPDARSADLGEVSPPPHRFEQRRQVGARQPVRKRVEQLGTADVTEHPAERADRNFGLHAVLVPLASGRF